MDFGRKQRQLAKAVASLSETVLLVEGERDRKAILELAPAAQVFLANGNAQRVAERLAAKKPGKKVSLLFDFDGEGNRKLKEFALVFSENSIKTDLLLRKKLRSLLGITFFEDAARKFQEFQKMFLEKQLG